MAKKRTDGFFDTIEYIGPRPQKPKKQNHFGGWVIVAIAIGVAGWFGRPIWATAKESDKPSSAQASSLISSLVQSPAGSDQLAAAALDYAQQEISYDGSYYEIPAENGDIPAGKGMAADVVVRACRKIGLDLQRLVHNDMAENFRVYPQLWDASGPDTNIDHRRLPNLRRFFERHGEALPPSSNPSDYKPGQIVIWTLPSSAEQHIGIVVPGPGAHKSEPWVVHHLSDGLKWEDSLFDYKIEGRFSYPAGK